MAEDKKPKIQAQKSAPKKEPTVYVGPNLKDASLMTYQVFKDGEYGEMLAKLLAEKPKLKALIVPVSDLTSVRVELSDKDSALSSIYSEISRGE